MMRGFRARVHSTDDADVCHRASPHSLSSRTSDVAGGGTSERGSGVADREGDGGVPMESTAPEARSGGPRSARSAILIVDDDEMVRVVTQELLEQHGYAALAVADGAAALEILRQERLSIEAVLLDGTLPRVAGQRLLEHLRASCPEVPVILCSGYPLRAEDAVGAAGWLQKPFATAELLRAVETAVRGGDSGDASRG